MALGGGREGGKYTRGVRLRLPSALSRYLGSCTELFVGEALLISPITSSVMAGMFEQPRNAGTLFLGGTKISGADIRDQNGAY